MNDVRVHFSVEELSLPWVYGRFWLDVAGQTLEDADSGVALNVVVGGIETYLTQDVPRDRSELALLPVEELVAHLDDPDRVHKVRPSWRTCRGSRRAAPRPARMA